MNAEAIRLAILQDLSSSPMEYVVALARHEARIGMSGNVVQGGFGLMIRDLAESGLITVKYVDGVARQLSITESGRGAIRTVE